MYGRGETRSSDINSQDAANVIGSRKKGTENNHLQDAGERPIPKPKTDLGFRGIRHRTWYDSRSQRRPH